MQGKLKKSQAPSDCLRFYGLFLEMFFDGAKRIHLRFSVGGANCRFLHGTPGQVGFARNDKQERVVEKRGLLPRERALVCRRDPTCGRKARKPITARPPSQCFSPSPTLKAADEQTRLSKQRDQSRRGRNNQEPGTEVPGNLTKGSSPGRDGIRLHSPNQPVRARTPFIQSVRQAGLPFFDRLPVADPSPHSGSPPITRTPSRRKKTPPDLKNSSRRKLSAHSAHI